MVKYYSMDHPCLLCHKLPTTGFVYVCEQDRISFLRLPYLAKARKKLLRTSKGGNLGQTLFSFHPNVQLGIERGHYTNDQIETLKAQKANVRIVIEDSLQAEYASQTRNAAMLLETAQSPLMTLEEKDGSVLNWLKKVSKQHDSGKGTQACCFKCCHSCRPASRDRTFTSFEAVLFDELDMPSQWHPETMPVQNYHTVCNIGLLPSPDESNTDENRVKGEDIERLKGTHVTSSLALITGVKNGARRASSPSLMGINAYGDDRNEDSYRQGMHVAFKKAIRTNSYPSLDNQSLNVENIQPAGVRPSMQRNTGQDIASRLVFRKSELDQATQIALPWTIGDDKDLLDDSFTDECEVITSEPSTRERCVRLTEEAMESRLPDIVLTL